MMPSIIPQLKNIGKSATLQINEASLDLEKKGGLGSDLELAIKEALKLLTSK